MGRVKMKPVSRVVLTAWRERMGYNKREAAAAIGCSRHAWNCWESGASRVPRYVGLALSALALGMLPYGQIEEPIDEDKNGVGQ